MFLVLKMVTTKMTPHDTSKSLLNKFCLVYHQKSIIYIISLLFIKMHCNVLKKIIIHYPFTVPCVQRTDWLTHNHMAFQKCQNIWGSYVGNLSVVHIVSRLACYSSDQ